ncbi:MAG: hypothetical protein HY904_10955 [Deltaproteobacteria bacterium]|nr:hypothetical protein [Deltaproteobacteria bacterium]
MGLRILFAGVPRFALALADAGHHLRAVVLPFLDDADDCWELVTRATRAGIPLFPAAAVTDDATDDERTALAGVGPVDLVLVASFDRRVAAWARALGTRGAWNVHPSLLPRHRGYNPYFWTILRGDAVSGVTVHRMTERFDDGDILARAELPVPAGSTSGQLWERLSDATMPLLLPLLEALQAGMHPAAVRQDHAAATNAPRPTDAHLSIDPTAPADDVIRHIRAATPEPGALWHVRGETYVVRGAAPGPDAPRGCAPGQVFPHDDRAYVAAGRGSFRPLSLELRGRPVALAELATGGA